EPPAVLQPAGQPGGPPRAPPLSDRGAACAGRLRAAVPARRRRMRRTGDARRLGTRRGRAVIRRLREPLETLAALPSAVEADPRGRSKRRAGLFADKDCAAGA